MPEDFNYYSSAKTEEKKKAKKCRKISKRWEYLSIIGFD
jgi:hypothetical protein